MPEFIYKVKTDVLVSDELINGKRHLTDDEIQRLKTNRNDAEDNNWENIFVSNDFDTSLVKNNFFAGFCIIGSLRRGTLSYHNLDLPTGIYNSRIKNCVIGDDCALDQVNYLENYRIGSRCILFNVSEVCCTNHAKFGNGILREGETEVSRIDIGIANENGERAVLPFGSMICADAYMWGKYRGDKLLMERFKAITENEANKTLTNYGIIGNDVIIKNTVSIKDSLIGDNVYIKGAYKIKNVTIHSSEKEPCQIGEGVELVNGIMHEGSRVFYQAIAVRFILGKNCQLKYGARLINSILGDNSTVSCCELLNNLIFPFHEQHHNSSFLIATTIKGQSNIAAGSTIGSNHNSRSPDGEIIAGRGFWPGLCSDFKHNSRFASFVLASKGSYQKELDISYPFSLLAPGDTPESPVHVIPAWWFMYNMFAIVRNKYKFKARDKRLTKVQIIETDPLAPDTIEEVVEALDRIISLTSENLKTLDLSFAENKEGEELYKASKDFLHTTSKNFTLLDSRLQKKHGGLVYKPVQAYKMYRKIVKYFASRTFVEYCNEAQLYSLTSQVIQDLKALPLYTEWVNLGGQVLPKEKLTELFNLIKNEKINDWDSVHKYYVTCHEDYLKQKLRYSIYLLERLYSLPIEKFTHDIYENIVEDVTKVSNDMYQSSVSSREKDFTDYFRCMPYDSHEEMEAVIGSIDQCDFLKDLKKDTEEFNSNLETVFKDL